MTAIGQDDHNAAPGQPGQGGAEPGNQPEFDYQRGYEQLRPEFTRVTQELSSTRDRLSDFEQLFEALHDADPEVQRSAMDALGLELETGSQEPASPDGGFVDPLEEEFNKLRGELDELRSARELEASERESQQLSDLRDQYIGDAIGFIEENLKTQHGPEFRFTDSEEEVLGNLAIAMEDKDGLPDVQSAYNLLYGDKGVLETNRERWIATKTGAAQPPLGTTIPADRRPKTPGERRVYIDERMRALDQQQ